MRASQIITLEIYHNNQWNDYTSGLINAEIIRGVEEYTGPLSQPDVGQLTLKSRNANLDPYNNNNIKYNAKIRVNAGGTRIFTGRIEGIEVEYGPRTEPTIVTINAFDLIGTMYKHILPEDFIDNYSSWPTVTLLNQLSSTGEVAEWQNYIINTDGTAYAEGPIELNTSVFDALNVRAKTDLGFYFANARNEIEYYRRDANDPLHPFNANPALITFDYDGNGESYRAISLNDGFEKIANEIIITGVGDIDTTKVVVTADDSISLWGKSSAEVTLATDSIVDLQNIGNAVLTEMAEPIREIYEITWDATLNPVVAKTIDIMHNIHINHTINENTSIDRKYGVIGIKHEINADDWLVTYIVRNYDYQATSIPNPVISIDPPFGGAEVDFTFSYTHPNPELITSQTWDLDEGFTSTSASPTVNYITSGTKTIILTVGTIYGYTKTTSVELEVGIAPPVADFTYTYNTDSIYQFVFTGDGLGTATWDFGDGTTSTEPNPTKYYLTGGSRTVTLTVTNSWGVDTKSVLINTIAITKVPVRFVRLKWIAEGTDTHIETNYTDANKYTFYKKYSNLTFHAIGGTQIAANWSLYDYNDFIGFMAADPFTVDEYNRTVRINKSEIQTRLQGSDGVYGLEPRFSALTATQWGVDYNTAPGRQIANKAEVMYATFDLGQEYFTFQEPRLTLTFPSGLATNKPPYIIVEVSRDNTNWYQIGNLKWNANQTQSTFTGYSTAPYLFANLAQPAYSWDYLPIRYLKLQFNAPTASASLRWNINEFIPFTGTGQGGSRQYTHEVNGTQYRLPRDCLFGLGGIDLDKGTGCDINFPIAGNSTGITQYSQTANNTPITQTVINPGTFGLTSINRGNLYNSLGWDETTGEKEFIIDFGQNIRKLSGFYIRTTALAANINQPTTVMNSGYTVTISRSTDASNWTTLGTFPMDAVNSGSQFVETNLKVRVKPDTPLVWNPNQIPLPTTNGTYYHCRPIHTGAQFELIPAGQYIDLDGSVKNVADINYVDTLEQNPF